MSSFFFDFLIFGYLTIAVCVIVVFVIQFARYGKRVLKWPVVAVFLFLIFSAAVIFYGSFIEPRRIVVTPFEIKLGDAQNKDQLKIALVSDFHVGPYKQAAFVEKAVSRINELKPDLIVIVGDFIFGEEAHTEFLAPLKNLSAPLGVFAVLGNHDYSADEYAFPEIAFRKNPRLDVIEKTLQEAGIFVLKNSSVKITNGNSAFLLGGTDEFWTSRADVKKTFLQGDPKLPQILAAHNPDIIHQAVQENVDIVLAGHTHAGQIRLPFLGPIPPLPMRLGRKYDQGFFDFPRPDGKITKLIITRGIGESGPRARLLAPPEIALVNLSP